MSSTKWWFNADHKPKRLFYNDHKPKISRKGQSCCLLLSGGFRLITNQKGGFRITTNQCVLWNMALTMSLDTTLMLALVIGSGSDCGSDSGFDCGSSSKDFSTSSIAFNS